MLLSMRFFKLCHLFSSILLFVGFHQEPVFNSCYLCLTLMCYLCYCMGSNGYLTVPPVATSILYHLMTCLFTSLLLIMFENKNVYSIYAMFSWLQRFIYLYLSPPFKRILALIQCQCPKPLNFSHWLLLPFLSIYYV